VKRLVASVAIASLDNGATDRAARQAAVDCASSYRRAIRALAELPELDLWYVRIQGGEILAAAREAGSRPAVKETRRGLRRARSQTGLEAVRKLTRPTDEGLRIVNQPPLVVPLQALLADADPREVQAEVGDFFAAYVATLPDDRQHLLDQYRIVDIAHKVVGVGSVGTRCLIVLLRGRLPEDPLLLQFKEAAPSVLEAHLSASAYDPPARRVVEGQRLMQTASDLFLGWSVSEADGRSYYWRQLRDMKGSADPTKLDPAALTAHGELCAAALAKAHARSGQPSAISAYLGKKPVMDEALGDFALRYAAQNAVDYRAHAEAIEAGRIDVRLQH
jgi:uncharacterized protein (DUF2252 family)